MASSAKAGRITVELDAGTGKFVTDIEYATAKMREFGSHGVTGVQATSAALRTLEGNMTNNLRAAERFVATTLGLGNALKAAFPIVGGIALLGVMSELIHKASDAYQAFVKLREAPKRIGEEFQAMTQPLRVANDELAVANDKLQNQIAKLEGHRQNTLKLALDEARLSADKLAESIEHDTKEVEKLLEQEQISSFKGFFTGNAATADLTDQFKKFRDSLADISIDTASKVAGSSDPKQQASIYEQATKRRKDAIESETRSLTEQLKIAQQLQAQRSQKVMAPAVGLYGPTGAMVETTVGGPDQAARISELKGLIANLLELSESISLRQSNEKLTTQKDSLEAAKERPHDVVGDRLAELQAKLREVRAEASAPVGDTIASALAKGFGEAGREIEQTSKALKEQGKTLTGGQMGEITALNEQIELTKLATREKERAVVVQERSRELELERLRVDQDVTSEIARQSKAEDDKLRKIATENDQLRARIKNAGLGPEAGWQAQYNSRAQSAAASGSATDMAELNKMWLEHQATIEEATAKINEQTDATRRLASVANEGLAAQRNAELVNIADSGKAVSEINAEIAAAKARFALEDAQTMRTATASQGVQRYFTEMVDNAKSAGAQIHDVLSSAFSGLNDTLARMISGQKASFAQLFQGLAEQVARSGLNNLEAGIAGHLMQGRGGGVWNEKAPGGGGVLGGLLGAATGKRDGSSAGNALYVQMVGMPGGLGGGGGILTNEDKANLGDFDNSELSQLSGDSSSAAGGAVSSGGFFGFLSSLFGGFRADGGDVDPGHAYMVGERGPEIWTPPSRGSIIPNHKLGGSVAYYTIDARGANEADVEMRVHRALIAMHGAAVRNSGAAQMETRLRRPRSKS